jgi:23S rRNA (adenine2503-C2)-methyltransferase
VLLAGVNDSLDDAGQLSRLLRGIRCKVNLIPFNPHPEAPYARPSHAAVTAFQDECRRLGLPVYLRTPRGDDIDAACGQLANRSGGGPIVPLRVRPRRGGELPPAPPVE